MTNLRPFGVPAAAVSRRTLLTGTLGAGALAALTACGGGEDTGGGGGGGGGTVTFGSNWADEVPKNAVAAMIKGYSGGEVRINTVDHNSFQENINSYLQGGPD
ncbi:hypothetical protein BU204_32540, partial [Actinophytocola xanthii]